MFIPLGLGGIKTVTSQGVPQQYHSAGEAVISHPHPGFLVACPHDPYTLTE